MDNILDENTIKAIKSLASGLVVKEITKEYVADDNGDMKLVKKKVNEKMLPPSTDICKMLYANSKTNENRYKDMTDEELEKEKLRLLQELQKEL